MRLSSVYLILVEGQPGVIISVTDIKDWSRSHCEFIHFYMTIDLSDG